MKINIAINNYETECIDIHSVNSKDIPPFEISNNGLDFESYIVEKLGYSLSNIEWFIFDEIRYIGGSK